MQDAHVPPLPKAYQVVTDRIIELLQQGVVPWRKPWRGGDVGAPRSLVSGRAYRGVNVFLLTTSSAAMGFTSPYWLTFRQAQERGGHVRKGEKSTPIVFWKMLEHRRSQHEDSDDPSDDPGDETVEEKKIPYLRYFAAFNVGQCEGIQYPRPDVEPAPDFSPLEACEEIFQRMPHPPSLQHKETRAFYRPREDMINMPKPSLFESSEEYYSTLFHEMVHSTGHASRLNRRSLAEMVPFGSESYAREELIAEMGSAFLCGRGGIGMETLKNSAAYIDGWLRKLKDDPKMVVIAAASAQKAADYILAQSAVREAARGMAR
jgi:antirestriction protein ArdC